MKKVYLLILMQFLCLEFPALAQWGGFIDHFEDGTMLFQRRSRRGYAPPPDTLWSTNTPATYKLQEGNGILSIEYSRVHGKGAYDHFTFTPPFSANLSANPRIRVSVKSSVSTTLTIRPVYSLRPPTYEYICKKISGDNEWHTYIFDLYPYLYSKFDVRSVDFYFDRGKDRSVSGVIAFDDFHFGGFYIEARNLKATLSNGNNVNLTWSSNHPLAVGKYKVYRDFKSRFIPDKTGLIGETDSPEFVDRNLSENALYYYEIIPVDTAGVEYYPSTGLRVETYHSGAHPSIKVSSINATNVKKYEKIELRLGLDDVNIFNPYDPEDIDVYALFFSPQEDTTTVTGFYDNYMNADQWKIRFSPNMPGKWTYKVLLKDAAGTGETPLGSFTATDSEHHGWIKVSKDNPHYFVHDDGSSYYAVAVYSPWGNSIERFNTYANHHANLLALWDIDYGGFVDETGIIEDELGRYNQLKLGRLDSMIDMLERRNINLMLAIWPHDLFSASVWATAWNRNPYSQLVDAVDVYSDPLVWKYQKMKYRYLIARYGYSRSLGIWEIINEMNGTDGWMEARYLACYNWIEKVNEYFKEHDPFHHPTTASFSGGFDRYREPLYKRIDVPNIHMYPAQGWQPLYPDDSLRSNMHNYAWASRRFWKNFDKPAIFGEAGADLTYFNHNDPRYSEDYHNDIWASLTNGLAGTPVWWQYRHLTDKDWTYLQYLSLFVSDIDFAHVPWKLADVTAEGADGYGLSSGRSAFGWVRSYLKNNISGTSLTLSGLDNGQVKISWFDTWNGVYLKSGSSVVRDHSLTLKIPEMPKSRPDIAFRVTRLKD